jgi:hypothetical protein
MQRGQAAAGRPLIAANNNNGLTVTTDFDWGEVQRYEDHRDEDRSLLSTIHENYVLQTTKLISITKDDWKEYVASQRKNELIHRLVSELGPIIGGGQTNQVVINQEGRWHSVAYCGYVAEDDRVRDNYHVLIVKAVQRKDMDWGRVIAGLTAGGAGGAALGAGAGAALGALGGPFAAITVPGGAAAGALWGGIAGLGGAVVKTGLDSTATMRNVVLGYMAHALIKSGNIKKVGQQYKLQLDS